MRRSWNDRYWAGQNASWWRQWARRRTRNHLKQLLRTGETEFPPYRRTLIRYMGKYDW